MAVPERGVGGNVGYVEPVQEVTESDPYFVKLMSELQNGGESVMFPGLEG
jgi:hypothetical protein